MSVPKCGIHDGYNWGRCPQSNQPYCSAINGGTCRSTNPTSNNIYDYRALTTEKCGSHYNNNTGTYNNKGRCTTSNNPCCSQDTNGYCGANCNLYNNQDNNYRAPTLDNCSLTAWGDCMNAPTCNGNQISTTGAQTRNYIQNSNCTIPVNKETLSQSCQKPCDPVPERCGANNNGRRCSKFNDCCSRAGFCGKGSNFCYYKNYNDYTQSSYCGPHKEEKDRITNTYTTDSYGYADHSNYCGP